MPAGALERAVELLGRVGERPGSETVAELAGAVGMPTSTAYRLLSELEAHGLIVRGADSTVALGTRLVALGRSAEEGLRARLVAPAARVMRELSEEVCETAILTAPCALETLVLHVVETEAHSVRLSYALFRRGPLHLGASGKVLAAYLEAAERRKLLARVGRPGLDAELAQIRERGFAFTVSELDAGAAGVAAPIRDRRGRLLAGLSVAGPEQRIVADVERLSVAVRAASRRIERNLQV